MQAVFRQLQTGHVPNTYENVWVTKDRQRRRIAWSNPALLDTEGAVAYIIGTGIDMTARQQAEAALQRSEALNRAIVDTAVDGIITIDEQETIASFNPAAEHLFGYTAEEVIGQNVRMLMPVPYCDEHQSYLVHYLQTGERKIIGIGREVVGQRRDGTTFPMDLAVGETHLGNRRIFTGIVRDITDRKAPHKRCNARIASPSWANWLPDWPTKSAPH